MFYKYPSIRSYIIYAFLSATKESAVNVAYNIVVEQRVQPDKTVFMTPKSTKEKTG